MREIFKKKTIQVTSATLREMPVPAHPPQPQKYTHDGYQKALSHIQSCHWNINNSVLPVTW